MKRTACVVVALAAVTAAGDLSLHQHPGHGPGYAQRALRGSTCDAACEDAQQAALESLFHNLDGSQWKRKVIVCRTWRGALCPGRCRALAGQRSLQFAGAAGRLGDGARPPDAALGRCL